MSKPQKPRTRRSPRRWVVPPGLLAVDEPYEGHTVVEEVQNQLGVLLWQSLRDADLWSTASPSARPRLFGASAPRRRRDLLDELEETSPLALPLRTIMRVLDPDTYLDGEQLTDACQTISRWAGQRGMPRTALAFAQSAALATPDRPGPAYVVGLLARRTAEYRRADTWFRRALALARRNGDWRYYGLACIGLGNLYQQRGEFPVARVWFVKALRVARRHGLWPVRSMALHDLFCAAADGGQMEEAEEFARRAFRSYGRRHPRLVRLAHDVANFWLMKGEHERALRVFRAVLPHIARPAEQRLVMANMARAAAGMRDRMTFASLWSDVWRMVDEVEDTEGVPEALL
ncbi:MAG TPA: tetratricopeptide repeat protein, partial [Longimicrobium sp.]|nr:tetratricopeptide repeat protein [Longimicrobium sp.]